MDEFKDFTKKYNETVEQVCLALQELCLALQELGKVFLSAWDTITLSLPPELLDYYQEQARKEIRKSRYLRRYNRRRKQ